MKQLVFQTCSTYLKVDGTEYFTLKLHGYELNMRTSDFLIKSLLQNPIRQHSLSKRDWFNWKIEIGFQTSVDHICSIYSSYVDHIK